MDAITWSRVTEGLNSIGDESRVKNHATIEGGKRERVENHVTENFSSRSFIRFNNGVDHAHTASFNSSQLRTRVMLLIHPYPILYYDENFSLITPSICLTLLPSWKLARISPRIYIYNLSNNKFSLVLNIKSMFFNPFLEV